MNLYYIYEFLYSFLNLLFSLSSMLSLVWSWGSLYFYFKDFIFVVSYFNFRLICDVFISSHLTFRIIIVKGFTLHLFLFFFPTFFTGLGVTVHPFIVSKLRTDCFRNILSSLLSFLLFFLLVSVINRFKLPLPFGCVVYTTYFGFILIVFLLVCTD